MPRPNPTRSWPSHATHSPRHSLHLQEFFQMLRINDLRAGGFAPHHKESGELDGDHMRPLQLWASQYKVPAPSTILELAKVNCSEFLSRPKHKFHIGVLLLAFGVLKSPGGLGVVDMRNLDGNVEFRRLLRNTSSSRLYKMYVYRDNISSLVGP